MRIIDPPVGPYHSPEEIRAWITELDTELKAEDLDEGDRAAIKRARVQAATWLERQE